METEVATVIGVSSKAVKSVTFLGVTISLLTRVTLVDLVSSCIAADRKIVIASHNLHSLCLYSSSSREAVPFRRFYDDAQYTLADGMSMVLLGRLQGMEIAPRHRVTYNDWLPLMLPTAVRNRWRIFYLGSTDDVAAKGTEILRGRYPGLQFESHHGHFDSRYDGDTNRQVVARINRFRPHLLFVGMGMPRQERWIQDNRHTLEANIILPSGATLDYIAGAKRLAPRWMGALGLEWAFRLATEPRRLAHRYLVEPWGLVGAVIANALRLSKNRWSPIPPDRTD